MLTSLCCILECIFGDMLTSWARYYFQILHHSWHYLMLETAVLALCVFTNCHQIHILVRCIHSIYWFTWSDVGKQLQTFTKSHIQWPETLPNWSLEWSLQSVSVFLYCCYWFIWYQVSLFSLPLRVNGVALEFNRNLQGLKYAFDTSANLWPDSIPREQHNFLFSWWKSVVYELL